MSVSLGAVLIKNRNWQTVTANADSAKEYYGISRSLFSNRDVIRDFTIVAVTASDRADQLEINAGVFVL